MRRCTLFCLLTLTAPAVPAASQDELDIARQAADQRADDAAGIDLDPGAPADKPPSNSEDCYSDFGQLVGERPQSPPNEDGTCD